MVPKRKCFLGPVLVLVSSAVSRKSIVERVRETERERGRGVERASARGGGLSDGEFWGERMKGDVGGRSLMWGVVG